MRGCEDRCSRQLRFRSSDRRHAGISEVALHFGAAWALSQKPTLCESKIQPFVLTQVMGTLGMTLVV